MSILGIFDIKNPIFRLISNDFIFLKYNHPNNLKKCKKYNEKMVGTDHFNNTQLEELARVQSDILRERLIDEVIEKEWKSKTIRTQATKFNAVFDYIISLVQTNYL